MNERCLSHVRVRDEQAAAAADLELGDREVRQGLGLLSS